MRRAATERGRAIRLQRQHAIQAWDRKWAEAIPVNRFRKSLRIGGCGNARCFLCHADKLLGLKTLKERIMEDRERDGLKAM